MRSTMFYTAAVVFVLSLVPNVSHAHGEKNVNLHVNPKWSQCSFQLDRSLTQQAWHEFTKEGGMVAYFRPLTDVAPMGNGNYEFSILQWNTSFDDTKAAWNDTFVHPDSVHWLKEGDRLGFPALMFRTGIADRIDAGIYWTKSPGANYGFFGGQLQYNFVHDPVSRFAVSARLTASSLYGPEDIDLSVYGLEILASRNFVLHSDWISVTPYAGLSTYLSRSHEKSSVVTLKDENTAGLQGMIGAVTHLSFVQLGVEYNLAVVSTFSFKMGVDF